MVSLETTILIDLLNGAPAAVVRARFASSTYTHWKIAQA